MKQAKGKREVKTRTVKPSVSCPRVPSLRLSLLRCNCTREKKKNPLLHYLENGSIVARSWKAESYILCVCVQYRQVSLSLSTSNLRSAKIDSASRRFYTFCVIPPIRLIFIISPFIALSIHKLNHG